MKHILEEATMVIPWTEILKCGEEALKSLPGLVSLLVKNTSESAIKENKS
jgi:hypothetical protein